MMNELPLVSICIPTYNSEKYIDKMLSTVINQTYKNIEVIISDNFSTDNTFQLLQAYNGRLNWKIKQNTENIGALNNMSRLIELANGKYVALYHADDMYEPEIVEKSVTVLENASNISMVSTMGNSIDDNDNVLSTFILPKNFEKKKSLPFTLVFSEILSQRPFFLITPSIMTRSKYYKDNSKFNSKYKSSADYGMWFEILQRGDLYIVNERLINYRTHNQQGTFLEIKENYKISDCISLYEDYAKKNKELYWDSFKYSYFKLMLIQAIKLNNIGKFRRSQLFLRMILKRTKKYIFSWIILFMFCNLLHIRFSLNNLLTIKKCLRK
ncbi:glycosyltransferase [Flavobacterium sp. ZB4R12]|uniref:glycosyltransferase n=1 Tax=Flavobacterium sp. ZB4R12 TaxID=3398732 RepID=UPI003AAF9FEB